MIVGVLSMVWGSYFLWIHDLAMGLGIFVAGVALARLVTLGMQEDRFASTLMGRILLLHLHPVNLLLQVLGFALLVYGFWEHSGVAIMTAVSAIFLGHMWGWHKVHEAL
jgi:hypothetical protein